MKMVLRSALVLMAVMTASSARPQATTRQCGLTEEAGPACLIAQKRIPVLPAPQVYWHIDKFSSLAVAQRSAVATSNVVEAFGSIWLFTIEKKSWRPRGGMRVSEIGPLPVRPATSYTAEYLRSVFTPGMTAPLHVHSGPEAFFAESGDTCLETPGGVKIGRGPNNSLMIEAGPPMLLMAIGKVPRRGFALILHDPDMPPTTLTKEWQPTRLCKQQFAADMAK